MSKITDGQRLKLAYQMIVDLEKQVKQSKNLSNSDKMPVAVVGIACRYPDNISGPETLWQAFREKQNAVKDIPENRWDLDEIYSANRSAANKTYCRKGAFFDSIDEFDSLFFNISHKEAERMDPQQRLFLEGCWEAFEDAGFNDKTLNGLKCGVYAGSLNCDYTNVLNKTPHDLDLFELMGTQSSILSARISYLLNLKGPSITLDTACSSSLVAIDLAVKAIQQGDIDIALAGGVHLYITPNLYIMMSKAQMLSEDGQCKAFDNSANGFAPGEGMGVVVLKRLDKAIEDRDQIYGLVLGGFSNQDGKTNGMTAPNSLSQTALEQEAYNRLGLNPETIGYIEAHGTGTKLGDPIEFEALSTAFRKHTAKKQFCAIGSSKTNFGHTLSAAGVTGVLKALLAMKYKKIPASLNFQKSNEHLDYAESPFFVNTDMIDWHCTGDVPRRSAVSSFGFSGTNVHLVLEEAPRLERNKQNTNPDFFLIPLSAKTHSALTGKVAGFKSWLNRQTTGPRLADISLTLLRGRCHFRYRAAFIVQSVDELKLALDNWKTDEGRAVTATTNPDNSVVNNNQALIDSLRDFETIDAPVYQSILDKLRALYLAGADLPWGDILSKADAYTISLPTYPFERDKHWISAATHVESVPLDKAKQSEKHFSFVDSNVSTLESQCYQKTFTGNEFYLKDHVVNLRKILPGVAYLEMARSSGNLCNRPQKVARIENVTWKNPIVIDGGPQTVKISLHPEQDKVRFQIFSTTGDNSKATIHSTGELVYSPDHEVHDEFIDVAALQNELTEFMSQQKCYQIFSEKGLLYGSSFKRILGLSYNGNRALATIEGLDSQAELENDALHPGIMDAALQAVLVLVGQHSKHQQRYLPYTIDTLELKNPLSQRCLSYVCRRDKTDAEDASEIFDVILADESGKILLRVEGLLLVPIKRKLNALTSDAEPLYFRKLWRENIIEHSDKDVIRQQATSNSEQRRHSPLILFGDRQAIDTSIDRNLLTGYLPAVYVRFDDHYQAVDNENFVIDPGNSADLEKLVDHLAESGIEPEYVAGIFGGAGEASEAGHATGVAVFLTSLVKSLMRKRMKNTIRFVSVYRADNNGQTLCSAISAFFKTLQQENPNYIGKCVEIPADTANERTTQYLLDELFNNELNPQPVRYKNNQRLVGILERIDVASHLAANSDNSIHYKHDGVYLITGGMHGIGLTVAEHICKHYHSTLVLTGRSAITQEIRQTLDRLNGEYESGRAIYLQADVSSLPDMENVLLEIKTRYGNLNGIIHSAGINRDSFILKQDITDLKAVLQPKVQGTLNLDWISREEPLDFFILFSSIAAVFGNAGQSDYAFANAFMDDYAIYREGLRKQGARSGKSLAINWPLWQDGGMQLDSTSEKNMQELFGMVAIDSKVGNKVIENSLNMPFEKLMFILGDESKINHTLLRNYVAEGGVEYSGLEQLDAKQKDRVMQESERFLKLMLSDEMKIPYEKIESSAPFENYGMDSVVYMELNRKLEEKFGKISKTLFYEYQNIAALAGYFAENHLQKLMEITDVKFDGAPSTATVTQERKVVVDTEREAFSRFISPPSSVRSASIVGSVERMERRGTDVAIVGISGRYPMANNLEEFWNNLAQGKDCIQEIPQQRWDHSRYFDPQRGTPGKTYSKWGGFIDGHNMFDPLFFNISPKEAALIDPQERVFLQVVWQAIADAGYTGKSLSNVDVGVYAGVMWSQYQLLGVDPDYEPGSHVPESLISSVANRISYFFNFHGPSIGLDTMCSSSLTAIHLAGEAIRNDECEYAIAGGVNLIVHPNKYLRLAQGNFSSSDGRCRSFGKGGDGYVPGEGVGAVLLKPLAKALQDHDHIYGVIKGSSINHGGKTNGYTVPNPVAQGDLIRKALEKAAVDAESISYVEAHGTGTALGDPIEITGLTQGFSAKKGRGQFCAMGSVKSNIGHLESAAGISAVTKVLLQMQHRQLVPTIHCEESNPNIDLEGTPFYLQKTLSNWNTPVSDNNGVQREHPRRAAISSFGAGGSNAHLIVEEAPQPVKPSLPTGQPSICIFSAKDRERLKAYAELALAYFKKPATQNDLRLADVAYTLQLGRDEENDRLAIVAGNFAELCDGLQQFLDGRSPPAVVFHDNAASPGNRFLPEGDSGLDYIKSLIKHQDFRKIAALWVQGGSIDWRLLYKDQTLPYRTPLPAAPFQNLEFWIPKKPSHAGGPAKNAHAVLHALIDTNTSTFERQSYQKHFSGHEFYLRDHVIHGEKILPASAFIEMARAAASLSHNKVVNGLSDIKWLSPLKIKADTAVAHINLFPGELHAEFDILDGQTPESTLYCSGTVNFSDRPAQTDSVLQMDLQHLSGTMHRNIESSTFYRALQDKGLVYGDSFRTLQSMRCNDTSVLATVALTPAQQSGFAEFVLHPAVLDAAFQAMVALLENSDNITYLPYSITSLTINGTLADIAYIYGENAGSSPADKANVFNIKLLDRNGRVLADIAEFAVMPFAVQSRATANATLFFAEQWQTHQDAGPAETTAAAQGPVLFIQQHDQADLVPGDAIVVLPAQAYGKQDNNRYALPLNDQAAYRSLVDDLAAHDKLPAYIIVSINDSDNPPANLSLLIAALTLLLQAFSQSKHNRPLRILVLHPLDESIGSVYAESISGFLKSLHRENPLWQGSTLSYTPGANRQQLLQHLQHELRISRPLGAQRHLSAGAGEFPATRRFTEINAQQPAEHALLPAAVRKNGVYLITGGAGGLGLLFAEYLSKHYSAKLILTGRSKPDQNKQDVIAKLNDYGSEVLYLRADVADRQSMDIAIEKVHARFGEIHGVIHSAGITRDSFLIGKQLADFETVLAPKVQGTVVLDAVTAGEQLDFFAIFSSIASVIGNAGQTDYATANAFQDYFAAYRNRLVGQNQRHGRTVAINWPLWREGGMQLNAAMIRQMQQSFGLEVLETQQGFEAFEQALQLPYSEIIVARGNRQKLTALFGGETITEISTPAGQAAGIAIDKGELKKAVNRYLKELISAEIRWPAAQISDVEPLGNYGIDSVMTLNLTNRLSTPFGELPKTLFFEYQTVAELSGFFVEHYAAQAAQLTGTQPVTETTVATSTTMPVSAIDKRRTPRGANSPRFIAADNTRNAENDIAIVGMSGRYPQAPDLETFYQNLKSGKDCITEIPAQRWDNEKFFDADRNRTGKCYSKWGGFVDDVDQFDPLFFNISPTDAITIDPQERLFLESVWNTIEDAGYTRALLAQQKVGVFTGVMWNHYQFYGLNSTPAAGRKYPESNYASIANRISYWFNFNGPSLSVDTMCSSSLTAIHYACESIKRGECNAAIAGGVNLTLHPYKYLQLAGSQFLSTDGRCRSFGEGGDGYVPGEGVGSVLLKPLHQARKDADHIYAVIRASAVNHGGKSNGFNVPSPNAQGDLIRNTLEKFSIDPADISYIEAHGTGTSLGDPIEIQGLKRGFTNAKQLNGLCAIGSVKSNIGHLEAASGVAGLAKVILQMQHRQLFPSLHAKSINPNIDLNGTHFQVQQELAAWPRSGNKPYLAGISSFGAGGSNAFIVVEEIVEQQPRATGTAYPCQLVPLSARTPDALLSNAAALIEFIQRNTGDAGDRTAAVTLENIAFTLQRREAMEERLALVCDNLQDLVARLTLFCNRNIDHENIHHGSVDLVAGESLADIHTLVRGDFPHDRANINHIAKLWIQGHAVDFATVLPELKAAKISLPAYRFQRRTCWYSGTAVTVTTAESALPAAASITLIDDIDPAKSIDAGLVFKKQLTADHSMLGSHRFRQQPLLPATAYLEMVGQAVNKLSVVNGLQFSNVSWHTPLYVQESPVDVFVALNQHQPGYRYEVWTEQNGHKVVHSKGTVQTLNDTGVLADNVFDIESVINGDQESMDKEAFYQCFQRYGIQYHNDFKCIDMAYRLDSKVLTEFTLDNTGDYLFSPAILDSALQAYVLLEDRESDEIKLPFSVDGIILIRPFANRGLTLSMRSKESGNKAIIADKQGNPCAVLSGIHFRSVKQTVAIRQPAIHAVTAAQTDTPPEVEHFVKDVFSRCLSVAPSDVKNSVTFDQYGVESVMAVEITRTLETTFGELPVTLLFEYPTINRLVEYLLDEHAAACAKLSNTRNHGEQKPFVNEHNLLAVVEDSVKKIISSQLGVDPHELKPNASFELYGMESVSAMEVTRELEQLFGPLPATTLFEYQSIAKLSEFLLTEFPGHAAQLAGDTPAHDAFNTTDTGNSDEIWRKVNALNTNEIDELLKKLLPTGTASIMEQEIMEREANEAR